MEVYDYTDPICPFNTDQYRKEPPIRCVPIERILKKLDEHLSRNDSDSGIRLLKYWIFEARIGKDERGELSLLNELMGIYRTSGDKEKAYLHAEEALSLAHKSEYRESITGATVSLNAATVYKAFGDPNRALSLYEQTLSIYRKYLKKDDYRFGSLYNNMGLVLLDLKNYARANEFFKNALSSMEMIEDTEGEQAITYLNIADLTASLLGTEKGEKEINICLDKAENLLESAKKRDGKYAFICDKCASVFGYYGRFLYEDILKKRAKDIYERN